MNMIGNTIFLDSYIYSNEMFFLTIIQMHFIETTKYYTIFWYMYYYQFGAFLTILKITAFLVIFWNVFIHSHREWAVKCRKDTCLDRLHFWNRTIIIIIQKIQYFSIHSWLKLLREYTLFQYDCIPSLTPVKMLPIFINNYFLRKE